jgi:PIN like domain
VVERDGRGRLTANNVQPLWYVDADTLGLAYVLVRARPDVTFPGDDGDRHKKSWRMPPCMISDPAMRDDEWIPAVTQAGLAIISRDKRIASRTAEKEAILKAGARMFAIVSPGNLRTWELLSIVVARWGQMERLAEEPGPYIYAVTSTGMHKIDLGSSPPGRRRRTR